MTNKTKPLPKQCACRDIDPFECYNVRYGLEPFEMEEQCSCSCHDRYIWVDLSEYVGGLP